MAYRVDDRWLWLGAGVALFIAVKGISYAIRDTTRLTEVSPLKDEHDEENQNQPEDSLPLSVLRTLATSPNPNIAKSATDLLTARCAKTDGVILSMQADAASSDPKLQRRARTALNFLFNALHGEMGHATPAGMRTGDGVGGRTVSPSVLSYDSSYEFDAATHSAAHSAALPPHLRAQFEREVTFVPSEDSPVSGWAAVARERGGSETDVRRRRREAMVFHEAVGELGEEGMIRPEDIIRPQMR